MPGVQHRVSDRAWVHRPRLVHVDHRVIAAEAAAFLALLEHEPGVLRALPARRPPRAVLRQISTRHRLLHGLFPDDVVVVVDDLKGRDQLLLRRARRRRRRWRRRLVIERRDVERLVDDGLQLLSLIRRRSIRFRFSIFGRFSVGAIEPERALHLLQRPVVQVHDAQHAEEREEPLRKLPPLHPLGPPSTPPHAPLPVTKLSASGRQITNHDGT